ncbi:hypothetical protein VNO77_20564 [Canavalia gladiata]|uniref:SGNH hydrolase-type esterase domain-containing protein n=1 Tax=Canavalia gladiata TaxID=3824 RepID=A0AAN9LUK7_CANGL
MLVHTMGGIEKRLVDLTFPLSNVSCMALVALASTLTVPPSIMYPYLESSRFSLRSKHRHIFYHNCCLAHTKFCYGHPSHVEPKTYSQAIKQDCWINSVQAKKKTCIDFEVERSTISECVRGREEDMVGPTRPQFVLFGSSIVQLSYSLQGWGAILAHLYARKADIVLRGYSGWNSRRALLVLDEIFPKNAAEQPSLIIVYFGGNDSLLPHPSGLGQHVPLQEYIENMRKIATHLKSLSKKTRIIFLSAPPVNEAQIYGNRVLPGQRLRTNESCRIYSEACLELCREMNIKGIDLWSAIQKRDDWKDVCFTDGIHLTSEGSKIVVKEILKVLKEADWEPSLYWNSMPTEYGEDSSYDPIGPDGKTTINVSNWTFMETKEWE